MPAAPLIETDRLFLRPHTLADFDAYAELWADPIVTRFIGGMPSTREQSWQRLLRGPGFWTFMGFGMFAIEEKATGRLIGETGFLELRRDVTPSLEGTLEMGWVLGPEAHGRGIATEAVGAAIAWGEQAFPARRMTCMIDPGNTLSQRVAGKNGFAPFADTTYNNKPVTLYERKGP